MFRLAALRTLFGRDITQFPIALFGLSVVVVFVVAVLWNRFGKAFWTSGCLIWLYLWKGTSNQNRSYAGTPAHSTSPL